MNNAIEHAIQFLSNDYHFESKGAKAEAAQIVSKLEKAQETVSDIEWFVFKPYWPGQHAETGTVNGTCMFLIDQKGIRKPKIVLKSYPFKNDVFTRANNTKKLGEFNSVEEAKAEAAIKLTEYLQFFLKK